MTLFMHDWQATTQSLNVKELEIPMSKQLRKRILGKVDSNKTIATLTMTPETIVSWINFYFKKCK